MHAESSTPEGDLLSVTLTVEALYLGFDLGWETPIFSMQILTLKLFGCLIPLTFCWDILHLLWGCTVEKLQIGALCAQCTSPIKWRTMVTAIQLLQQLVPRSSWRLSTGSIEWWNFQFLARRYGTWYQCGTTRSKAPKKAAWPSGCQEHLWGPARKYFPFFVAPAGLAGEDCYGSVAKARHGYFFVTGLDRRLKPNDTSRSE